MEYGPNPWIFVATEQALSFEGMGWKVDGKMGQMVVMCI
jgi:hypothetical protein